MTMKTIKLSIAAAVPEWAKWAAQDEGGIWWAYAQKPKVVEDLQEWSVVDGGIELIVKCNSNPQWRKTLKRIK
jgi:hypothetical protein